MRVLAIETSCDETGVALVEGVRDASGIFFNVLGQSLLSQAPLHAAYGGVYPTLAKREHQKNLPLIFSEALTQAGLGDHPSLEAIAVTQGPGLEPALWQGITFAQSLSREWKTPLMGINHMEGHLISSLAHRTGTNQWTLGSVPLPVLALLVSGGHTEFIVMKKWLAYERIGETLDDAVGECFDKVARMLGLPYPGGPEISRLAREARQKGLRSELALPRPMLRSKNCDVSFSGLKTAALYALRGKTLSEEERQAFARELEDAVAEVFIAKTRQALKECDAKTFVLGGGVAANVHLRESLTSMLKKEFPEVEIRLPELSITGDNAVMIAEAALTRLLSGGETNPKETLEMRADGALSIA
ncbi:MAG: tRNA (adenosine(37)-N6)-threonylcarbamoyltransferase complex transferase subunit TsaD [Patescibacteria group bacterium]|nr:tRNA (adenosine(37)-N6)-threonylcarbamoyltransferase complex transferase subunit TsaD [Patescibacteria group bacterium]